MLTALLLVALAGATSASPIVGDAASCRLCTAILKEAKVAWTDPSTQDLIKLATDGICATVPIEDCSNWINEQVSVIDQSIAGMIPQHTCASIGMCPAMSAAAPEVDAITDVECDFCEFVGDEVVKYIVTNASIDLLVNLTESVCSKIPLVSNECEQLVMEYGNYYLHLIADKIDVAALCVKAGLCKQETREMIYNHPLFAVAVRSVQEGEGCAACKDGMDMIKLILNSPDLKDLTHIAVKEFCSVVHFSGCDAIVEVVINQILNEYVPKFDPENMCIGFGACPNNTAVAVVDEEVGDAEICEVCHDALAEVKKIANDPGSAAIVTDLAPVICEAISIPFCARIIGSLVTTQFDKLKTLDPTKECVKLAACPAYGALNAVLKAVNSNDPACDRCTQVADQVIAGLEDEQVDTIIRDEIGELCSLLPLPDCKETLDGYLNQLISLLKLTNGKQICTMAGICEAVTPEPEENVGDTCGECTLITGMVITSLSDDAARKEVTDTVSEICAILPGKMAKSCEETVDEYVKMLLDYIAKMDPKDLCGMFGLCSFF